MVENIQVASDKRSHAHVCTECDVESKLITRKPDEDLIRK